MIPSKLFLTKGVGKSKDQLVSFELALRDAKIAFSNLVYVSSIFPPGAKLISKEEGIKLLSPGQITFCVMSRNASDENNRLISASVGLCIPNNSEIHGYISEHHMNGQTDEIAGKYSEKLAIEMLESTLEFKTSEKMGFLKTTNVTQSAICKNGLWTTVIAAAVFCDYNL